MRAVIDGRLQGGEEPGLWLAVLNQALLDAESVPEPAPALIPDGMPIHEFHRARSEYKQGLKAKRNAIGWLSSPASGIGSFRWILEVLNVAPQRALHMHAVREAA